VCKRGDMFAATCGEECVDYASVTCNLYGCAEYCCERYGAAECPKTRVLNNLPGWRCATGPITCKRCYWMGLDGKTRFCSVGKDNSPHYCYYGYKSGFEVKKS